MAYVTVLQRDQLAPGELRALTIADVELILYRVDNDYYAAQRYCLHQHADLVEGELNGGFLICAAHGWRFSAATGCHEYSPTTCLLTYAVRVVGDDIQIDPTPLWRGEMP